MLQNVEWAYLKGNLGRKSHSSKQVVASLVSCTVNVERKRKTETETMKKEIYAQDRSHAHFIT